MTSLYRIDAEEHSNKSASQGFDPSSGQGETRPEARRSVRFQWPRAQIQRETQEKRSSETVSHFGKSVLNAEEIRGGKEKGSGKGGERKMRTLLDTWSCRASVFDWLGCLVWRILLEEEEGESHLVLQYRERRMSLTRDMHQLNSEGKYLRFANRYIDV